MEAWVECGNIQLPLLIIAFLPTPGRPGAPSSGQVRHKICQKLFLAKNVILKDDPAGNL